VLLYGLSHGIRSSRRLEWACGNAVDFIWLAQGQRIDHSTFCQFRTNFAQQLKDLFRQIGQVAMHMGMVRLNQVALDGTKVKANSSRHGVVGAATLEARLAALDEEIETMFREAGQADHHDTTLFGESVSPNRLPRKLSELKRRQARLAKALEKVRRQEAAKRSGSKKTREKDQGEPGAQGEKDEKEAKKDAGRAKIPMADPDSKVHPNKEGGFAPNYTPVATTDVESGFVVASDVLADSDESEAVIPTVEQIQEDWGRAPEAVLADSGFNSGRNLEYLDGEGIEGYIPSGTRACSTENPAQRERLDQPVAPERRKDLPIDTSTKRLGRSSFVYDGQADCYYCPMGKMLAFSRVVYKPRRKGTIEYRRYTCKNCEGCPLRGQCLTKKARRRTIDRDRHEPFREARDRRLYSPAGQRLYRQRAPGVEGAFGQVKSVVGLRQFLHRGLEKVRTEWRWACTALNVRKLVAALAAERAAMAEDMATHPPTA